MEVEGPPGGAAGGQRKRGQGGPAAWIQFSLDKSPNLLNLTVSASEVGASTCIGHASRGFSLRSAQLLPPLYRWESSATERLGGSSGVTQLEAPTGCVSQLCDLRRHMACSGWVCPTERLL